MRYRQVSRERQFDLDILNTDNYHASLSEVGYVIAFAPLLTRNCIICDFKIFGTSKLHFSPPCALDLT